MTDEGLRRPLLMIALATVLTTVPVLSCAQTGPLTLCIGSGSADRVWRSTGSLPAFQVSPLPAAWGAPCGASTWIAPTSDGSAPLLSANSYATVYRDFTLPAHYRVLGGEMRVAFDHRVLSLRMNSSALSVPCTSGCESSCTTIPVPASSFRAGANRISLVLHGAGGLYWGLSYELCIRYEFLPTPTPTVTRTPSRTFTATRTNSPTATPTRTVTRTVSPTVTWTGTLPTVLWTFSPTHTVTGTVTDTPTYVPTWTPTPTGTRTLWPTFTPTLTPTYETETGLCGRVTRCLRSGDADEAVENPWLGPVSDTTGWPMACAGTVWVSKNPAGDSRPYPCSTSPPDTMTVRRVFYLDPTEAAYGRFHLCLSADDDVRMVVNGVTAASCTSEPIAPELGYSCHELHPGGLKVDLPASLFKFGPNVIEFVVDDVYCYKIGLSYELCMDLPAPCDPTATPTYNPLVGGCGRLQTCYHSGDPQELLENPHVMPVPAMTPWPSPCAGSAWITDNPTAFSRNYPCVTSPARNILVTRTLNLTANQVLDGRFRICMNADDEVRVSVNGVKVSECLSSATGWEIGNSCWMMYPGGRSVDIPASAFRVGSNVLEFLASDVYCYLIGLSYTLCVDIPVDCTPTPTWTITITPTVTPTKSPTVTRTATWTRTPAVAHTKTFTPTITPTRTWTSTRTLTGTRTPTWTRTPSITPTRTPTRTTSATRTHTRTHSPTPTVSGTPPPPPTETFTVFPTATPTRTPTCSFTPTRTNTSTLIPTKTPTRAATSTRTPTPDTPVVETSTWTHTPTIPPSTVTATPTHTPTRTFTLSTPIPTGTPTFTRTSCFTHTPTPSFTPTPTPATITPTWTPTPTFTFTRCHTMTPTGTYTPSPTWTVTPTDTWTPTPTST